MFVRRLFVCVVLMFCCAAALGQFAGQNINMVSGTTWPAGDPYLQRQNEPSMAVSSRNPEHLLGGANDYRTVDIPNPAAPTILGDAWLGVYSSLDGGETWKSTLLPGYPQDTSSIGTSSPLHAFTVATDPTVRAGTNGMFYYSGLVFNRGAGAPSGVFVATFQDQNNKGNGNAAILTTTNGVTSGNAFSYIGVNMVDSGTTGQFLDKPWIVVDIPRSGRTATCKGSDGKTFSSGYVYVVYTQFNGSQNNPSSKIKEVTSTNCGASWDQPQILSQSEKVAQGTVAAIDPINGNVYVAWRQIAVAGNMNQPDAIQYAVSTNGGWSFSAPPPLFTFAAPTKTNLYPPGSVFDQPQASGTTFRTLDVPTMAVDGNSRVWVAFSERVNGPMGTYGSRIMITTLASGASKWTTPYVADSTAPSTAYGHQFMPALNFAYGKLMLAWFDSRRDNMESVLKCPTGGTCGDLSQLTVVDQPIPGSTLANPATIFTPTISDPQSGIRHTIDVFGGIVNPSGGTTTFKGFQISQYPYYFDDESSQIEQGFFNPPNLPMFVQGTTPFIGDYIDIASQNILPSGNSWAFNTQATDSMTGATNAPDFHITWTDNRDVVPPPIVNGGQDWTQYEPPNGGRSGMSTYSGNGNACPTCSTIQPACTTVNSDNNAGDSAYSGDRNENVYTSRISNGLIVRFRENAKQLSGTVQTRSFSLLVKNTVSPLSATPLGAPSYYRILLGVTSTSATQTPTCTITGGTASLSPAGCTAFLDIAVNPKTTFTQAITVNSTTAAPSVQVLVAQTTAIPAQRQPPVYVFQGLQALAAINTDPSNPLVANPDFLSTDNSNPDALSPYGTLPITAGESYDPTVDGPPDPTINTPKIGAPLINTPKIATAAINTPKIDTPTIVTVANNSPIYSVQVVNPTIVDTINTPKINTPKINTPKIVSPDIYTPKITDPTDGNVTDYSWTVNNKGNTSASYNTSEFAKSSGVQCCPASCTGPPNTCGTGCSVCQLIQHKVYESPVANRDSNTGNPTCDLNVQQESIVVANISDPAFITGGAGGGNPSNPSNSTLSLSPGEGNRVTLRVQAPPVLQTTPFKTVAAGQSNDSNGQAATSLTIQTSALPVAVVGQPYIGASLTSLGGVGASTTDLWSFPVDPTNPAPVIGAGPFALPVSPLTLAESGKISTGTVTQATGTYPFFVQVQDSATTSGTPTPSFDVQNLTIEVNKLSISSITATSRGVSGYLHANGTATVVVMIENDGPAIASSVTPTLHQQAAAGGTAGGNNGPGDGPAPALSCQAPSPSDIGPGSSLAFTFNCTAGVVNSGNGTVTFSATGTGTYHSPGAADATGVTDFQTQPASPSLIVDTTLPVLSVVSVLSNAQTYTTGNWTNHPVTVTYSCTDNLSGVNLNNPVITVANSFGPSGSITIVGPLDSTATVTLTADSANSSVSATCQDVAGNVASTPSDISPIMIDQTNPIVTVAAVTGGNNYAPGTWATQSVAVTYTCKDNLSGAVPAKLVISNLPGGVIPVVTQVSNLVSTAVATIPPETGGTTLSATCSDVATNQASSVSSGPIMIDNVRPVAMIASPVPAAVYINNQPIPANYGCTDELSGVAACVGSPAAPSGGYPMQTLLSYSFMGSFTQTAPGPYTFSVAGADVAGNSALGASVNYSTAYYSFTGFQAPLAPAAGPSPSTGTPPAPTNSGSFVAGATIPILWTLAYPNGSLTPGPVTDPTTLASLSVAQYANSNCSGSLQAAVQLASTQVPNGYGYDSINQRFAFNWNTPALQAPGCYELVIAFNDLSSYSTNVTITSQGTSNALNFASGNTVDGTNSNLPGNSPQTMEAWINPSSTASGTVFSYVDPANANKGFGLAYVGQHMYLIGESNDVIGSVTIPINQWTHVAVSYDGTNATLYVNGALDKGTSQTATGGNLVAAGGTWRIGDIVGATAPDQPFVGMLDEVKVWNAARTASQIVSDMTNELCVGQAGVVAYYKFNEGTASMPNTGVTTLLDVSSSAANGTLNANFSLAGSTSNWVQGNAPVTADDLSIGVSPGIANFSLSSTNTQQFTATGNCTDGGTPTLTPIWSLNSTVFATVSSSGLLTATATGTTTVTAAYADATGSATVTVTQ